jgi:hypothetical protein
MGKGQEEYGVIPITEAAKSRFFDVNPACSSHGEVMRLDTVKVTANAGDQPRLAACVGEPEEGDHPVEREGRPLLYVLRVVSAAYDGCGGPRLDPEGAGFAIGPPEAGRDARS